MAVYKKWQLGVIGTAILLILAGGVALLRPDLVPYATFRQGVGAIRGLIGDTVSGDGADGATSVGDANTAAAQVKKDLYRIELKTGGRIYTDNLQTGDGKLTYTTASGLVVTIESHEVIGVEKFKDGEEPPER